MSAIHPTLEEELLSVYRQLTGHMAIRRRLEEDVLRLENEGVYQRNENRTLRKENKKLEDKVMDLREAHQRELKVLWEALGDAKADLAAEKARASHRPRDVVE